MCVCVRVCVHVCICVCVCVCACVCHMCVYLHAVNVSQPQDVKERKGPTACERSDITHASDQGESASSHQTVFVTLRLVTVDSCMN